MGDAARGHYEQVFPTGVCVVPEFNTDHQVFFFLAQLTHAPSSFIQPTMHHELQCQEGRALACDVGVSHRRSRFFRIPASANKPRFSGYPANYFVDSPHAPPPRIYSPLTTRARQHVGIVSWWARCTSIQHRPQGLFSCATSSPSSLLVR